MPVLGESEKARLQRIFEWSNRGIGIPEPNRWRDNDQATNEEVQLIRKQVLGRGALRKQKRWLDILANEVVERETVLKVMRAEGQEHLSKDKLRHEIHDRIKRMKEIQNNIARQERQEKQSQMAELVDPTNCCQATYNAQRDKSHSKSTTNETNKSSGFGLSSQSKRLLEHNLNTSADKPAANHRRYKHSLSPPALLPSFKGSCGSSKAGEQSKENLHLHRHHHHHHRRHVEKRPQESALKSSRHPRTSCKSDGGLKTKSASRP